MGGYLARPCLFQWGSRAGRHVPERTALDQTYGYDGEVLIIGAGAAGLAAARVLEENQIRYSILEATDRYGGRLKADATFADFPVDLGAEWIHNLPGILGVLSGPQGEAAQPTELVPYHLEETCSWDGRRLKKNHALFNEAVFRFFPEYKFKCSTWYDFVCRAFAENVQQQIRFNSPVTEVDYQSGNRVQVTTASGERFTADKVLMTASIGVLQSGSIAFVPNLSGRKKAAIASVGFLPGFKLLLKFSEKFYPDAIEIKGGADGEKGFYDAAFKKDAQDNVLGFIVTGPATAPFYALTSEKQIVAAVLAELEVIYGSTVRRAYTGEYRLMDWGRQEFTKGTWVEGFRVDRATLTELNAPLEHSGEHKVYFAGEAHDCHQQMGVPGAVLSGLDAVDRMLRPPQGA
jgi:monoamine oxidase